jgi:2'-5' RNA ligase
LTEAQASLIADDWNHSEQDAHYVDVGKGDTRLGSGVFHSSMGRANPDAIRNFVKGVLSGQIHTLGDVVGHSFDSSLVTAALHALAPRKRTVPRRKNRYPVHSVADSYAQNFRLAFLKSIDRAGVVDEKTAIEATDRTAAAMTRLMATAIGATVTASGQLAAMGFKVPVRHAEAMRALKGPQTGMRFDAVNPLAVKYALEHAAELVTQITDETRKAIQILIARALSEGIPPKPLGKLLREVIGLTERQGSALVDLRERLIDEGEDPGDIDDEVSAKAGEWMNHRADVIAHSSSMRAANKGTELLWDQAVAEGQLTGNEQREWVATIGERTCPLCAEMDGALTGLGEPWTGPDGEQYDIPQDAHPQCLLPGTEISGHIVAGLRAFYSGPAREIRTANGCRLRVTVNHPVLTKEGWVAAAQVRKGAYLLSQIRDVDSPVPIDNQQHPALVEDVFQTMFLHGSTLVNIGALDLHGDAGAVHGDVDIVVSDARLLADIKPLSSEGLRQFVFPQPEVCEPLKAYGSTGQLSNERITATTTALPGSAALPNNAFPVVLHGVPLNGLLLGCASEWDVVLSEAARQDIAVNSAFVLELQKRSAGQVSFDEVVEVRDFEFRGHVYDLQSPFGWIIAQGIVISNCRCTEGISAGDATNAPEGDGPTDPGDLETFEAHSDTIRQVGQRWYLYDGLKILGRHKTHALAAAQARVRGTKPATRYTDAALPPGTNPHFDEALAWVKKNYGGKLPTIVLLKNVDMHMANVFAYYDPDTRVIAISNRRDTPQSAKTFVDTITHELEHYESHREIGFKDVETGWGTEKEATATAKAFVKKFEGAEFNPDQERDENGQWAAGGSSYRDTAQGVNTKTAPAAAAASAQTGKPFDATLYRGTGASNARIPSQFAVGEYRTPFPEIAATYGPTVTAVPTHLENPYVMSLGERAYFQELVKEFGTKDVEAITAKLVAAGHDGMIIKNVPANRGEVSMRDSVEVVVFHKSAVRDLEHSYASTQVNLDGDFRDVVLAVANGIPDEDLAEDGQELEPHITLKYGLHDDNPNALMALLRDATPIEVTFGTSSFWSTPEYDVVKIDVVSKDLQKLNTLLTNRLANTETQDAYRPHVTVAYVRPGCGVKYAGVSSLAGMTACFSEITFSSSDDVITVITLAQERMAAFSPDQERDEHGRWTSGVSDVVTKELGAKGIRVVHTERADVAKRGGSGYLPYQGRVVLTKQTSPRDAVHEIGHAYDHAMASDKRVVDRSFEERGAHLSDTLLKSTLAADLKAATPLKAGPSWDNKARSWEYAFSSPREAFAHIFNALHGDDTRINGFSVKDAMPRSYAAVEKLLRSHRALVGREENRSAVGATAAEKAARAPSGGLVGRIQGLLARADEPMVPGGLVARLVAMLRGA